MGQGLCHPVQTTISPLVLCCRVTCPDYLTVIFMKIKGDMDLKNHFLGAYNAHGNQSYYYYS